MAGFRQSAISLRAPKLAAVGAKSPIVSGGYSKYSCIRETAAGDRVRSALRGGRAHFLPLPDGEVKGKIEFGCAPRRWFHGPASKRGLDPLSPLKPN
jgi:hypothetical protein